MTPYGTIKKKISEYSKKRKEEKELYEVEYKKALKKAEREAAENRLKELRAKAEKKAQRKVEPIREKVKRVGGATYRTGKDIYAVGSQIYKDAERMGGSMYKQNLPKTRAKSKYMAVVKGNTIEIKKRKKKTTARRGTGPERAEYWF